MITSPVLSRDVYKATADQGPHRRPIWQEPRLAERVRSQVGAFEIEADANPAFGNPDFVVT